MNAGLLIALYDPRRITPSDVWANAAPLWAFALYEEGGDLQILPSCSATLGLTPHKLSNLNSKDYTHRHLKSHPCKQELNFRVRRKDFTFWWQEPMSMLPYCSEHLEDHLMPVLTLVIKASHLMVYMWQKSHLMIWGLKFNIHVVKLSLIHFHVNLIKFKPSIIIWKTLLIPLQPHSCSEQHQR